MRTVWTLMAVAGLMACGNKKPTEPVAPIEGWHAEEGWSGECFYPPNWSELGDGSRRDARAKVMTQMLDQWGQNRDDGLGLDEDKVMEIETVLLGKPEFIENVSAINLQKCIATRNGSDIGDWRGYVRGLRSNLTAGDCKSPPLRYNLFDYLDIGTGFQIPAGVCKDDHIRVQASANDYYRIVEGGPWINADGDPAVPTVGTDLPCNVEGCLAGQLIVQYTTDAGVTQVFPAGLDWTFRVPEHGEIKVTINDTTYFDNVYKIEGSLEHHTSIEYGPAE